METTAKVYVAGHTGMVGSAIVRKLRQDGFTTIITRSSKELDLRNQSEVINFFRSEQPDYVFLAAAKVGGIMANKTFKAEFLYENLMIQTNVIHTAYLHGVKKLLFLGSSCIYPKHAPQPLKEEYLLAGALEPTNESYAVAKISGIKMCDAYRAQYGCNFISVMPTSLYGPNDNYDPDNSHVIPALFRKIISAKNNDQPEVTIWGSGKPKREFMHVDDLACACLHLMDTYNEPGVVNVGIGEDIAISDLVSMVVKVVGYKGDVVQDLSMPDGTPRKLMDVSKLCSRGWSATIPLETGLKAVYDSIKSLRDLKGEKENTF